MSGLGAVERGEKEKVEISKTVTSTVTDKEGISLTLIDVEESSVESQLNFELFEEEETVKSAEFQTSRLVEQQLVKPVEQQTVISSAQQLAMSPEQQNVESRIEQQYPPQPATDPASATATDIHIPYIDKWNNLQASPYILDDEYIMVREVRYPITHQHGNYRFEQIYEVLEAWERAEHTHPLASTRDTLEKLLFFDTETTGLHGGTGNTIFLLGYCRFEGDSVVVRQHYLAAPHAEVPLYNSFLNDARDLTHLVTYNGKAFDWPQVKTRHTLVRDLVPQLPAFGHYDLLHGARRLWKNELPSCRMFIIEQEKLGVHRTNDVPGYMAPELYFDYLREKDPEIIQGVLHHNEMDVLSLITLYIHMSKLLLETNEEQTQSAEHSLGRTVTDENLTGLTSVFANVATDMYTNDHTGENSTSDISDSMASTRMNQSLLTSPQEQYEIARWYEAVGQVDAALLRYQSISNRKSIPSAVRGKAMIAIGHLYKKQKANDKALATWEAYLNEQDSLLIPEDVLIEVAKLYEHHVKDYEKALHYSVHAFDIWKKKAGMLRSKLKSEQQAHEKRIERLQKKVEKFN